MALSVSQLGSDLEVLFGKALTPEQGAQEWATTYRAYAANATSPMGGAPIPATLDAAAAAMQAVLVVAFRSRVGVPAAFNAGLATFWPLVVFAGVPPGTCAPPVVPPPILPLAALALARAPKQVAAQAWAAALHLSTVSVICTHPVAPTPVVGPIS